MARSTRSSSRRSSSRSLPVPDSSDEEDVVRPYVPPARLESPFGTERMAAAISIPHRPSSRIPQQRRVYHQRQRQPPATVTAALPADVQAAIRRSQEAEANNCSAFNNDDRPTIDNGLEMEAIMNTDAAIMEAVDENTADLDALLPRLPRTANGTFNCCNSLRNAGAHSAIQPVSSDIIDYRFCWRIRRMQDHYLTTPVSSPPSYCYGLRIRSSKPSQ